MAICKIYKDTTADNLEFFKKAIWLNNIKTYYSNFKSIGEYLQNTTPEILERGILFLKDISTYEESSFNNEGAMQVIKNLKFYYEDKAKKDPSAAGKLQAIKKVMKDSLN